MTPLRSDIESQVACEYSQSEREELLQLARRTIESTLRNQQFSYKPSCTHLCEMRGAFTTLHLGGKLRGCVGYVLPVYPLFETIADNAAAAAFKDSRFNPVTLSEVPQLQIEISVLSQLSPIAPEDVILGLHGLVVSLGTRRGLLLPQVPIEWNWDRDTFLAQTCRKAGLAADAWKQGAVLEAFTAEIFGDSASPNVASSAK
jgi:uncharacterized protein